MPWSPVLRGFCWSTVFTNQHGGLKPSSSLLPPHLRVPKRVLWGECLGPGGPCTPGGPLRYSDIAHQEAGAVRTILSCCAGTQRRWEWKPSSTPSVVTHQALDPSVGPRWRTLPERRLSLTHTRRPWTSTSAGRRPLGPRTCILP